MKIAKIAQPESSPRRRIKRPRLSQTDGLARRAHACAKRDQLPTSRAAGPSVSTASERLHPRDGNTSLTLQSGTFGDHPRGSPPDTLSGRRLRRVDVNLHACAAPTVQVNVRVFGSPLEVKTNPHSNVDLSGPTWKRRTGLFALEALRGTFEIWYAR